MLQAILKTREAPMVYSLLPLTNLSTATLFCYSMCTYMSYLTDWYGKQTLAVVNLLPITKLIPLSNFPKLWDI